MKPHHDFVAERALAQHCAELLPAPEQDRDIVADVSAMAIDIARELTDAISGMSSGSTVKLVPGEAGRTNTTAFINKTARQTAHCVIDLPECGALMLSIDHKSAHALTDRAYGGTGETPDPLPDELPLSADLTLQQMETTWCEALSRMFTCDPAASVSRRGGDLSRLDPFRGQGECVHLQIVVEEEEREPWVITIAASLRDLHLSTGRHRGAGIATVAVPVANDPTAAPFADIPLPARAVLAQMPISVARASAMKPGDVIPLSIAREVPLSIAGQTVALGIVGTQDDRVALQITRNTT